MSTSWTQRGLILAAAMFLTSCERPVAPPSIGELSLSVVSGDQQSGSAGQELPNPLVVQVTKPNGGPVNNQVLNFRVVSGGGSVFAGTALTDSRGIAQERWTLGSEGEQKVEVRAVDTETGAPLVFATFTATVICHDCWMTKAPLPIARDVAGVVALNGMLYAIGGDTAGSVAVAAYDPQTDTWSSRAPMPPKPGTFGGAAINGILYAVAGGDVTGTPPATLQAYDPATNTWTEKAPMPSARSGFAVAAVNGILYAIGGKRRTLPAPFEMTQAVEAYDPVTDSWTTKADVPFAEEGSAAVAAGGFIYVIGGSNLNGETPAVQRYDPVTNTWTRVKDLELPVGGKAAAAFNGRIFAMGGTGFHVNALSRNDEYDPIADTWTPRSPVPTPRVLMHAAELNGLIYAVGGRVQDVPTNIVEAYRP
jgi:N-acetylneuraminic acid mutarotase